MTKPQKSWVISNSTKRIVPRGRVLMRGYFWGVVGCAAGVLTPPALAETVPAESVARQFWQQAPMTFTRLPAAAGREVAYIARGPGYAVRLTQQSAALLVAQPRDSKAGEGGGSLRVDAGAGPSHSGALRCRTV